VVWGWVGGGGRSPLLHPLPSLVGWGGGGRGAGGAAPGGGGGGGAGGRGLPGGGGAQQVLDILHGCSKLKNIHKRGGACLCSAIMNDGAHFTSV